MTPMKAIREKCLECCGGSWRDVKFCTAGNCPEGYTDIPQDKRAGNRKEGAI